MENFKLSGNTYLLSNNNIAAITNKSSAAAKKSNSTQKNTQYTDPLEKWPVRGLAYTNEIGAAISEIAPKTGLLLWVPALLYFGADIYDKYKNDQTSYDPSAKRGTKQAVFQLLASVILPTAAVKAGQKTASAIAAVAGQNKLSLQSQEELLKFTIEHLRQNRLRDYADKQDEYLTKFAEKLSNHIDETKKESKFKTSLKLVEDWLFNRHQPAAVTHSTSDKITEFTQNNLKKIFKIRETLLADRKPDEFSDKMFNKFRQFEHEFATTKDYTGDAKEDAAKLAIKLFEEKQIFKNKLLKTLGGFIALGFLAKPIDNFVENFVIHKVVNPGLTMLNAEQIKKFKEKTMLNKS